MAKPPPPVRMEAEAGYNGLVRSGRPVPVRVSIDNDGEAAQARIEIRSNDGADETEMEVALPRGARKRYTAYVVPQQESDLEDRTNFSVRLLAGRRLLAERSVTARFLSARALLALSVTGDAAGLQFLDGTEWPPLPGGVERRPLRAVHLAPGDFPSEWAALAMVDVVAANGRGWTALDGGQRRALREWVELGGSDASAAGGRAILCGDLPGDWQDADAASLLAIHPGTPVSFRRLVSLRSWTGRAFIPEGGGAILGLTGPAQGDSETFLTEAGATLVRRRYSSRGAALWIGFDAFGQAFRSWDRRPEFWQSALRAAGAPLPRSLMPLGSTESYDAVRSMARSIPKLGAPPVGALIAFAAIYLVVFGPLNIWLLRRMRRTVRAWLLMPALAAGMTVALVAVGQSWGSNRTVLNVVTLLETASGARSARQQTLVGLFSPTNRTFDVTVEDPAPLFQPVDAPDSGRAGASEPSILAWPTRQGDGRASFEGQAQALYSIIERRVERAAELGGTVTARPRGGGLVEVTNRTPLNLRRCALWRARNRSDLGDLPAGARRIGIEPPPRRPPAPAASARPGASSVVAGAGRTATAVAESVLNSTALSLPANDVRAGAGWLMGEVPDFDPALRFSGIATSSRLTLLLVRIEGPAP